MTAPGRVEFTFRLLANFCVCRLPRAFEMDTYSLPLAGRRLLLAAYAPPTEAVTKL